MIVSGKCNIVFKEVVRIIFIVKDYESNAFGI